MAAENVSAEIADKLNEEFGPVPGKSSDIEAQTVPAELTAEGYVRCVWFEGRRYCQLPDGTWILVG